MLRSALNATLRSADRALHYYPRSVAAPFSTVQSPTRSTATFHDDNDEDEQQRLAFFHHGQRPRYRNYIKFKSPRKRASNLLHQLNTEAIAASKASNPKVWQVPFKVGDAIELNVVEQGGAKAETFEKIRGVVLGRFRKGLDESVLIRDIVYGSVVEYQIMLHSPLLKGLKVLEENFIFKGKRKVKRAKLYYLRDRNPLECQVTKPVK